MSDDEDSPLEEEFQAACNRATQPDEWMFVPYGDTDFEKGLRRGIELVLLTIRDTHGTFDLRLREEEGELWLSLPIYENLTYREDFTQVIAEFIRQHQGRGPDNSDELKFLAAFLRATADEVDTAINWKPPLTPRQKKALEKKALEEEP